MKISLLLAVCIFIQFGFSGRVISKNKNIADKAAAKAVIHSGLIGCKDIDGVLYTLYGSKPGVIDVVVWSGGSTGTGNYGTCYTTPILGVSGLSFTGPNGAVSYSGSIYTCGD